MSASSKEPGKVEVRDQLFYQIQGIIPLLRASLANVMKVGADVLAHQLSLESGGTPVPPPAEPFDKALEDFYNHCDHATNLFMSAYDSCIVTDLSNQYSNIPVRHPSGDGSEVSQSYSDFIVSLNKQVTNMEQMISVLETFSSDLSGEPR